MDKTIVLSTLGVLLVATLISHIRGVIKHEKAQWEAKRIRDIECGRQFIEYHTKGR